MFEQNNAVLCEPPLQCFFLLWHLHPCYYKNWPSVINEESPKVFQKAAKKMIQKHVKEAPFFIFYFSQMDSCTST